MAFHDEEISLLQAFANQAAIAVDNARLIREIEERNSELSESLELQTATSEVLELISAHPGELDIVLEGIIERTSALVDARVGVCSGCARATASVPRPDPVGGAGR